MKATSYSNKDILDQLDECTKHGTFPVLDNINVYLAGSRLTVFRSEKIWALTIEVLGYGAPRMEFVDDVYLFGNEIAKPGTLRERIILDQCDDLPFWDLEEGKWLASWREWCVVIQGQRYSFTPTPHEYLEAGLEIDQRTDGPSSLRQDYLIRFLCYRMGDMLFAKDDILVDLLETRANKLLQIREWRHPDVAHGELVSQVPFFCELASAIVDGREVSKGVLANPNTHWSNWPTPWY